MHLAKKMILNSVVALGIVQCYYFLSALSGYFVNHTVDWLNLLLLPIGAGLILTGRKAGKKLAALGAYLLLGVTALFYLIQFMRLADVRKVLATTIWSPGEINALLQGGSALLVLLLLISMIRIKPTESLSAPWQRKWQVLAIVWGGLAVLLTGITSVVLYTMLSKKQTATHFLSIGWSDAIWNTVACFGLLLVILLLHKSNYRLGSLALLLAIGLLLLSNYVWSSQFIRVISATNTEPLTIWSGEVRLLGLQLLSGLTAAFAWLCYWIGGKRRKEV